MFISRRSHDRYSLFNSANGCYLTRRADKNKHRWIKDTTEIHAGRTSAKTVNEGFVDSLCLTDGDGELNHTLCAMTCNSRFSVLSIIFSDFTH